AFAEFLESLEISSVDAVKNGSTIGSDHKATEAAMGISKKARTPMMRRRERNAQRTELDRLPFIEFMNDVETESMDQTSDANRDDNWLIGSDETQCAAIEMIEMRVSHKDEIDRR